MFRSYEAQGFRRGLRRAEADELARGGPPRGDAYKASKMAAKARKEEAEAAEEEDRDEDHEAARGSDDDADEGEVALGEDDEYDDDDDGNEDDDDDESAENGGDNGVKDSKSRAASDDDEAGSHAKNPAAEPRDGQSGGAREVRVRGQERDVQDHFKVEEDADNNGYQVSDSKRKRSGAAGGTLGAEAGRAKKKKKKTMKKKGNMKKRTGDEGDDNGDGDDDDDGSSRPHFKLARNAKRERLAGSKIAPWERVLCVGIACVDIVDEMASFPVEDSEQRSLGRLRRLGGNGANMIRATCQFDDVACSLMYASAPKTADPNVVFISSTLSLSGISEIPVYTAGANGQIPTSYILQSRSTGSRTIIHYRNLPELNADDFHGMYIPGSYTWVHFEGRSGPGVQAMLEAVESGCTVSLEIEKPRPPFDMLLLIRHCDVVMIGKDYVKAQGFTNARDFLANLWGRRKSLELKVHVKIVVPWGEEGAYAIAFGEHVESDDPLPPPEIIHTPAVSLDKPIVDSVGAGDVFNGTLLVGLLRGLTLREAMQFACLMAGHKCTQQGIENLGRYAL